MRAAAVLGAAAALAGGAAASRSGAALQPLAYLPLPTGSVLPQGWLYRELRLQGDGLSGNFQNFWDPVNNTQWLGGTSTFEDWYEIFPYVLQGYTLQAILLNDTAQLAQTRAYLEAILGNMTSTPQCPNGGWMGPPPCMDRDCGMTYWPRWPVMNAFYAWYEYTGEAKWISAALKWTHCAAAMVAANAPGIGMEWTGVRLQDWVWSLQYLVDLSSTDPNGPVPATEVPFLLDFAQRIQSTLTGIVDWEGSWYVDPAAGGAFPTEAVPNNQCNLINHGVNNGQAIKSGAVRWRLSGEQLGIQSSYTRLQLMDRYHGVPTGAYTADEHLAGNMPSHGTETCAVVEYAFSTMVIHETLGDALFAERTERLTYNALPGGMTKDLWARVYLQQMNEPVAVVQQPHVWISDGSDAIIYSLEGNFACCTANFNQGWPRTISRAIHAVPGGGAAISVLGPVTATLPGGVVLNVSGEYPFEDDLTITLSNLDPATGDGYPLHIRIPSWADAATLSVNGGPAFPVGAYAGSMYQLAVPAAAPGGTTATVVLATNPAIRVDKWYNGSLAVHRGALLYAVQLDENITTTRTYYTPPSGVGGSADYAVTMPSNATLPWNLALIVDPAAPQATLTFQRTGPVPEMPYASHEATNVIRGTARPIAAWGFAADGSAAPPPASPVDCTVDGACGAPVAVTLVPYGSTLLRITEVPYTLP